jgi:hypothetical protein
MVRQQVRDVLEGGGEHVGEVNAGASEEGSTRTLTTQDVTNTTEHTGKVSHLHGYTVEGGGVVVVFQKGGQVLVASAIGLFEDDSRLVVTLGHDDLIGQRGAEFG